MQDDKLTTQLIYTISFSFLVFFAMLITVVLFIYFSRKKISENEMKNKDMQILMQKKFLNTVIKTQEEERIRISRDLHDEICSKLNAVSMSVHLLKRETISNSDRKDIADNTLEACLHLIDSTRRIAHNLMPPTFDNLGISIALDELCRSFSNSEDVHVVYENEFGEAFFADLCTDDQIHLFRIFQELISNSLRHGSAHHIIIKALVDGSQCTIEYTDDGVGISEFNLESSPGLGIKNIFSRIDIMQAKIHFDLKVEAGFRVLITI